MRKLGYSMTSQILGHLTKTCATTNCNRNCSFSIKPYGASKNMKFNLINEREYKGCDVSIFGYSHRGY